MTGSIRIITEKPIAYDSPDHLVPYGTARDNSVSRRFNQRLSWGVPLRRCRVLDLGCAGGGFVKSILDAGGFAVGIEGSDYSQRLRRAGWATIPTHLFTADATSPFQLVEAAADGQEQAIQFNIITGWEFLEHIKACDLGTIAENIQRHLLPSGIVIFSINTHTSADTGVELHQTIHAKEWWLATWARLGFIHHEDALPIFGHDWVRWKGSFHLILTRAGERLPFERQLPALAARGRIYSLIFPNYQWIVDRTIAGVGLVLPSPVKRVIWQLIGPFLERISA